MEQVLWTVAQFKQLHCSERNSPRRTAEGLHSSSREELGAGGHRGRVRDTGKRGGRGDGIQLGCSIFFCLELVGRLKQCLGGRWTPPVILSHLDQGSV